MKIQINSLEALERLIGGDTEVEIELRNTIVQEFTKTHLKAIANLGVVSTLASQVQKEITTEFLVTTKQGYTNIYNLTPEVVRMVKESISQHIKKVIADEVDKAFKANVNVSNIEKIIEERKDAMQSRIDRYAKNVEDLINTQSVKIQGELHTKILEGKIDKMVTDKIKEKFEL